MGKISKRDALDEELAQIAADPAPLRGTPGIEDASNEAMTVPGGAGPSSKPNESRGNYGLLATLLVMAAAIVGLFMFGFKDAAVYSVSIDKLAAGDVGRRVRIEGELVPGTLTRRDKPCEYRFKVKGSGKTVDVHYPQCTIPDTFRDRPEGGVLVTAEGKLTQAGHFEASLILAKCSSKYDPSTHKMGASSAAPVDEM
jgi:cytochrome c-type biogenesis protein CcmE